jgi:hypothetical protein
MILVDNITTTTIAALPASDKRMAWTPPLVLGICFRRREYDEYHIYRQRRPSPSISIIKSEPITAVS